MSSGESQKVYTDFQQFLIQNSVVTTSAGVIVGIATYQFVRNASFDVLMPLMDRLLFGGIRFLHPPTGKLLSKAFQNVDFHWLRFIQELITWLTMLFATFLILKYFLSRIAESSKVTANPNVNPNMNPN